MTLTVLAGIVALLVFLFLISEVVSAVLPLIIVLTFVPQRDREALAGVLAALDSSRRLRLWPALRLAVTLRRQERRMADAARDPQRNPYAHLNEHFAGMPGDAPLNPPYDHTGPASPGHTGPASPGHTGPASPDYTGPVSPGHTGPVSPEHAEPVSPPAHAGD